MRGVALLRREQDLTGAVQGSMVAGMTETTVPDQASTDAERDEKDSADTPTLDTAVDGPILSDENTDAQGGVYDKV